MSLKNRISGWDWSPFVFEFLRGMEWLWGSGNPAFGFPLPHSRREPELRECGNRASDFQGLWAAEVNLHLVFLAVHGPSFPQLLLLSRDLSMPDAVKEFSLCFLHGHRGLSVALRISDAVEYLRREVVL